MSILRAKSYRRGKKGGRKQFRAIHDFVKVRKLKRIPASRDPYGYRSSEQKD